MADPVSLDSEKKEPQPKSLMQRVIDGALLLVVVGALAVAVLPKSSGPNVGQPASIHELAVVGSGKTQTLPGKLERPLLIEAFASWCGACKRTSGTLADLNNAVDAGKLDVVAVSVDDSEAAALSAKRSWPIEADVLHDATGDFSRNYRVDVLPTYILVGTDGRVQRVTAGVPGASDIRAWLNAD